MLFGAFIAAAIVFVTPADTVRRREAGAGLAHADAARADRRLRRRPRHRLGAAAARRAPAPALLPQTDLAILNWRREKSVFLGTNQPQEDASWIFQLRMAELERAKAGRTSEPRPWNRLAARLFDYAIWGLVLALLLVRAARRWASCPKRSPTGSGIRCVAPMLITGTWVPIEALLIASLATTPGKWLFGCYLQFSISDAYAAARRAGAARARASSARSASGGRAWAAAFRCSRRS